MAANRDEQVDLARTTFMEFLAMAKTRAGKKNIEAKLPVKRCLHCEKEAAIGRRGLCQDHYDDFNAARERVARMYAKGKKRRDAVEAWDDEQVAAGRILKAKPGRRPKANNVFAEGTPVSEARTA